MHAHLPKHHRHPSEAGRGGKLSVILAAEGFHEQDCTKRWPCALVLHLRCLVSAGPGEGFLVSCEASQNELDAMLINDWQVERVGSQQLGVRQLQLYATLLQALAALGIQGLMSQTPTILQPEEVRIHQRHKRVTACQSRMCTLLVPMLLPSCKPLVVSPSCSSHEQLVLRNMAHTMKEK